MTAKKTFNKKAARYLLVFSIVLSAGCVGFLIYYLGIQPARSKSVTDKYRKIYYSASSETVAGTDADLSQIHGGKPEIETSNPVKLLKGFKKGEKNDSGILRKFEKLLQYNSDVKGWISIPGTKIDYPVLQSGKDPDYYLTRDFEGHKDKNGSLFIDEHCAVRRKNKNTSKNIVIHGHNMQTTDMMFYELPEYKDISYYREHPLITFDTIYGEAVWKIFALMRVSGNSASGGSFDFMRGDFDSDEDFLNFLYQIEQRSLYKCPVTVNEKDSLLMLSTCSYEVDNYRTVVVARKVRKNESPAVDTTKASMRSDVLYPDKWYGRYGGKPPVSTSFSEAMSFGEIDWYDGKIEVENAIGKVVEVESLVYEITSKTTLKFLGCTKKNLKEFAVPSTQRIEGRLYDVTEISKDALVSMDKLETVKIGDNISEIPAKLFTFCPKLKYAAIGTSVTSIGKKAFFHLDKLEKITIRSSVLESVGEKAFKGLAPKAKIKVPEALSKKYTKLITLSGASRDLKIRTYTS